MKIKAKISMVVFILVWQISYVIEIPLYVHIINIILFIGLTFKYGPLYARHNEYRTFVKVLSALIKSIVFCVFTYAFRDFIRVDLVYPRNGIDYLYIAMLPEIFMMIDMLLKVEDD